MNLNSRETLIKRLRRGKRHRAQFVASHLSKGTAYQLRAIRNRLGWNQDQLAKKVGMTQNAISRLESPHYGKPTLSTLKRLAAGLDVGLIVRFVPFSEMIDWVSGTPRVNSGLTTESLAVANFQSEEAAGIFDSSPTLLPALSGKVLAGPGWQPTKTPLPSTHTRPGSSKAR